MGICDKNDGHVKSYFTIFWNTKYCEAVEIKILNTLHLPLKKKIVC